MEETSGQSMKTKESIDFYYVIFSLQSFFFKLNTSKAEDYTNQSDVIDPAGNKLGNE